MAYKSPQDAEQDEREAAQGRITLDEAARRIGESEEDREDAVLAKLEQAVLAGALPVYAPGATGRYLNLRKEDGRSNLRTFYLRCYVDDLDRWLADHEPRITFRFETPLAVPQRGAAGKAVVSEPPDWVQIAQEEARRIIDRDRSRNPPLFPSQELVAEEVAKILKERRLVGKMRVPLSAATIKRHALKGIKAGD